ncbi:hypothetical protein SprV_0501949100 [Sparganum proliferum]
MPINITHNPDTLTNTNTTTVDINNEDLVYTCPHCNPTFTLHVGLIDHLRIHRTETGEPVPGAPTYTRRTRLHCLHCPRILMHCMGLFSHMRIHESGIDRSPDTPSAHSAPTMLSPTHSPSPSAPTTTSSTIFITDVDTDTVDFSCPHCPHTFPSHIGLVDHLRIHRTETGKPVPGAPTSTRRILHHCPHCTRTFIHRMGLLGHVHVHDNLR